MSPGNLSLFSYHCLEVSICLGVLSGKDSGNLKMNLQLIYNNLILKIYPVIIKYVIDSDPVNLSLTTHNKI